MPTVTHVLDADCPPEALWAVLADLGSVARTNPLVRAVRIVGSQTAGSGAMRQCDLVPKGQVTERVTRFDEGRAIGFEVVESDWPVRAMSWTTTVEPRPGGARLRQRLDYRMKFGPLGWLLDSLVMRRMIRRNVGRALDGAIAAASARPAP